MELTFMAAVGLFCFPILLYLLVTLFSCVIKRRQYQCKGNRDKLPPGSMGWPYIGETLHLYSQHPDGFLSTRLTRYGEIFKTHILGCPCVMLASPEAARFVLVTNDHLFKPTYPKSKENLIGPSALFFHQGQYHMRLRKIVQGQLCPQSLKQLVSGVEQLTVSALDSCSHGMVINTYAEMKKLSFEVGILAIFGYLESHYKEKLKKSYAILDRGYNSLPVNLPGSKYQKAMKARKKLSEVLGDIMKERREKNLAEKDLLSCLLNFKYENGETLSEDQIADNVIGVLFAAKDTTASAMTWLLKFLHDNPQIFKTVKEEHDAIYKINDRGKSPLTWHQTRNMRFTHKVIWESLRMASILSFTFREAVADVEYKGYVIPKGWKVMPLFRTIHHNAQFFPEPQSFDPSRFERKVKPYTFIPFGIGKHACPGNELAKLELLISIHHLVTNFRYELMEPHKEIEYGPFPVPRRGLLARFSKQQGTLQPQEDQHV